MPIKLICVSHTPLLDFASPPAEIEAAARATFQKLAEQVKAYDPTLIVVFGPDHFNGFFYDLMPSSVSVCVQGLRVTGTTDLRH